MRAFRPNKEQLSVILLFLLFVGALVLIGNLISQEQIRAIIDEAGIYGPVVWVILTVITYVLAPLSGTPMIFVGFYAFGRWVILYTILAGIIGSAANFYIARKWGRNVVERFAGKNNMHKIDSYSQHYGVKATFLLRVFLPNFHEYISYAAGLTTISFKSYFLVTIASFIPIGFLWYIVTLFTNDPLRQVGLSVALSFTLFGVFAVWLYYKKRLKKDVKT